MKVLIACEESGVVRSAFRARGHDAWSNDLEYDAGDGSPHHIKGDCKDAIRSDNWDLIVMHPPCDFLAVSGNRWYGKDMPMHHLRLEAIMWTVDLWRLAKSKCDKVVMENPVSVIWQYLTPKPAMQYIQPHMFGHPEFKNTGLALHNVPPLVATDQLVVPKRGTPEHREWQKVWLMGPSPERKKLRSRTYTGVGEAMADQWGSLS